MIVQYKREGNSIVFVVVIILVIIVIISYTYTKIGSENSTVQKRNAPCN